MSSPNTGKYQNNMARIAKLLGDASDQSFTMVEIAHAIGTTPSRVWVSIQSLLKYGLVTELESIKPGAGKRYQGKADAVLWGAR